MFLTQFFLFPGCIGYIQEVTSVQHSKSSSNLYFDVTLQVSSEQVKEIRVMHLKGQTSKRQLFVDRKTAQQPVKLSNMTMTQSGTIFLIKVPQLKMCQHMSSISSLYKENHHRWQKYLLYKSSHLECSTFLVFWNGMENHTFPLTKPHSLTALDQCPCPCGENTLLKLKRANSTASQIADSVTSMANAWPPQNRQSLPQQKLKTWQKQWSNAKTIYFAAQKY